MEIKISIADLVFSLNFKKFSSSFLSIIKRRYKNFIVIDEVEKSKIDVYFIKDLPSFSNFGIYKDFIAGEGFIFSNNELFIRENTYCFENFLRVFYSHHLLMNNGALIHSAGVFKDNFSFIFIGKSGTGKTTISKIFSKHGFSIMSDEVCGLRFINNDFYLYSTPFWGNFKKPNSINIFKKLSFIFFPFKSKNFFVKDISKREAVKKILSCVFNFSSHKEISSKIFGFVLNLVEHINYKAAYFTKDGKEIVDYLDLFFYKKNN